MDAPTPAETDRQSAVTCSALLAELEAALRRDACIIARIARSGEDPKNDPAFARYCALEDACEAERRYSAPNRRAKSP